MTTQQILTINDVTRILQISRTTLLKHRKIGLLPEPHFVLCNMPRWYADRFFAEVDELQKASESKKANRNASSKTAGAD